MPVLFFKVRHFYVLYLILQSAYRWLMRSKKHVPDRKFTGAIETKNPVEVIYRILKLFIGIKVNQLFKGAARAWVANFFSAVFSSSSDK